MSLIRRGPVRYVTALLALFALPALASAQTPTYANVTYLTVGGLDLKLDLYMPPSGPGPFPVILWIHGGAWVFFDKSMDPADCASIAAEGFAVASLDYRQSPQAPWPAQLHDCKAAVRWLRANAATYNLDAAHIGAHGYSSGAQLAAMLGVSQGDSFLEGSVGGNLGESSAIQCWSGFGGPYSMADWQTYFMPANAWVSWVLGGVLDPANPTAPGTASLPPYALCQTADPKNYCTLDDAPAYLAHGELDDIVQVSQSLDLFDALRAAGVEVDLRIGVFQFHNLTPIDLDGRVKFFQRWLMPSSVPYAATLTIDNPIIMDSPATLTATGVPFALCFLFVSSRPDYMPLGIYGNLLFPVDSFWAVGIADLGPTGVFQYTAVTPHISGLVYYPIYIQGLAQDSVGGGFAFTNLAPTHFDE